MKQLLQLLVHAEMATTRKVTFQQKNSKINTFVIQSFLEPNLKRFINAICKKFT